MHFQWGGNLSVLTITFDLDIQTRPSERPNTWIWHKSIQHQTTTTVLRPCFQDHPGEPVPEENFWDFTVQRKINRGRHTNHPAGHHSIRTKQCPPPSSPMFFTGRMPFQPSNQQCQNLFSVPEIFHKQTKKSQRALKTEPYAIHCVQ